MTDQEIGKLKPLVGWKQIGAYFDRSAESARMMHQRRRMPINYLPGGSPAVYADDLRAWVAAGVRKKK